ncbi:MAG: hypothetical protein QXU52_00895 [Fervidicoccaceae archaeon]
MRALAELAKLFAELDRRVSERVEAKLREASRLIDEADALSNELRSFAQSSLEQAISEIEREAESLRAEILEKGREREKELVEELESRAARNFERAVSRALEKVLEELGA